MASVVFYDPVNCEDAVIWDDVEADDEVMMGRMFTVARKLAEKEGVAENGYRLIVNCNPHGGQEVYHVHMHIAV